MAQRIYIVKQGETKRLVRAASQAVACSHVAKSTISVEVASPDDTFELALAGVVVEETSLAPVQRRSANEQLPAHRRVAQGMRQGAGQ